jgi:hypothetical protein
VNLDYCQASDLAETPSMARPVIDGHASIFTTQGA